MKISSRDYVSYHLTLSTPAYILAAPADAIEVHFEHPWAAGEMD
jgi:hypothetical protein